MSINRLKPTHGGHAERSNADRRVLPFPGAADQPVPVANPYLWDSVGFVGHPTGNLQFKDDGTKGKGMRQFSARLWNIPNGEDWESAAQNCPAVIKRQYFNRPTRIVDKGVGGLWGEFDVLDNDDVPDWFWGHMEKKNGAPHGHTRYRSRLWGLSLGDDWKKAAKQTPALVAGQYFDEPTKIEDKGAAGLWGIFDVSDDPSPVPAPTKLAQGENSCMYCQVDTVSPPDGWDNVERFNLTTTMNVGEFASQLYAVVTKDDDSVDFPDGVVMSIKDSKGRAYDKAVDNDGQLIMMQGDSVQALVVDRPEPGDWTMTMSVAAGAKFRCECNTVPGTDVFDTMLATARQRTEAAGGIAPRGTKANILAAFVGVAAVAVLAPEAALVATLTAFVTGVGIAGIAFNAVSKNDSAEKMGEVAGLLSKIGEDVQREGYAGIKKYRDLIGKNITKPEIGVILENPQMLLRWLGVHRRVFQVVEHMTDAEEQNSVRHVYWQCLLTKRLGVTFATAMGDAHERGAPGSDADNKADEVNNRIGQKLASEVESEEECLKRTRELWKAGKLAIRPDYESDPT